MGGHLLTTLDGEITAGSRTQAIHCAVILLGEQVTVESLRPLRMIGVGVDVVVGKFLRIVAPERPHVGDVAVNGVGDARSKLCILELLRVNGGDRSEQQGQRSSGCHVAVVLGKHHAG